MHDDGCRSSDLGGRAATDAQAHGRRRKEGQGITPTKACNSLQIIEEGGKGGKDGEGEGGLCVN